MVMDALAQTDVALIIALVALAGSLLNTAVTVLGAPVLQARRNARKVLDTYREPRLAAAFELQARLHNILHRRFVEDYVIGNRSERTDAAVESTLYVFGQFFAWREIIRREIRIHDLAGLATGMGERMISHTGERPSCIGYTSFVDQRPALGEWFDRLERDLRERTDAGRGRLTQAQHLFVDLVTKLDKDQMRYPIVPDKA
jgi:hypothetical protein